MTNFTEYEERVFRHHLLQETLGSFVKKDYPINSFDDRLKKWKLSEKGRQYTRIVDEMVKSRTTRSNIRHTTSDMALLKKSKITGNSESLKQPKAETKSKPRKRRHQSEPPAKSPKRKLSAKKRERGSLAAVKEESETLEEMTATEAPEEVGEQGSPSRKKAGESTTNAKHTRKTACPVPLSVTENFPLRFDVNDFRFERSKLLGEGHIGKVMIANYRGLPIACKCRRSQKPRRVFHDHIARELTFAAKLSVCRFMNPYLGVFECSPQHLKFSSSVDASGPAITATSRGSYKDLYIVQRYYEHGDLRDLMEKRATKHFHPIEVLQIAISLSAALTDAHKLGIGIVDLKLENILMDANGSGWITDFGSCVEMNGQDELNLIEMQIPWTNDVAAPEMIQHGVFRKESDIFMAMLIVAEVMTPNLSDKEFQEHVLSRHKDGSVNFRTAAINPIYSPFYGVLQRSLHSDPKQRPDALSMLFYFEAMRKESLTNLTAQIPMSFRDTKQDDISTYGDDTTDFILSSADSASDLSDVNHE